MCCCEGNRKQSGCFRDSGAKYNTAWYLYIWGSDECMFSEGTHLGLVMLGSLVKVK